MKENKRVRSIYRCRSCGEMYRVGEYDAGNLSVCQMPMGLYQGERVPPSPVAAAMVDIHVCDACAPRFGVADLVGWE